MTQNALDSPELLDHNLALGTWVHHPSDVGVFPFSVLAHAFRGNFFPNAVPGMMAIRYVLPTCTRLGKKGRELWHESVAACLCHRALQCGEDRGSDLLSSSSALGHGVVVGQVLCRVRDRKAQA